MNFSKCTPNGPRTLSSDSLVSYIVKREVGNLHGLDVLNYCLQY